MGSWCSESSLSIGIVQTRALHCKNDHDMYHYHSKNININKWYGRIWKTTHLRSSETDTSLDPQEDQVIRKIEPSCPTSLHTCTASYRLSFSKQPLEDETPSWSWSSGVLEDLSCWGATFQTTICPNQTL